MKIDRNKIDRNKIVGAWIIVASFFLPVILMLLLYVLKGIYPFGEKGFITGDLYHQYIPFFEELLRKWEAGESLNYSFRAGIGSNFLALYVYYLASPFNLLARIVPQSNLVEFIGYMTIFKTGLCGLTAAWYVRAHFRTKSPCVITFAVIYSFSGYLAAYSYNIMWMDCVWVFPLIVLGLERLVLENRWGLYCLSLAFSIYTNYYISIMICFFCVLYFFVLMVIDWKPSCILRRIGNFALFSLLAGGLAGVLLVPEVMAIIKTDFSSSAFPDKIKSYFSILDVLARHCVGVSAEKGLAHWPNIYSGTAVILLVPLYIMNPKISTREKFLKLGLAGFLLLSFCTNVLEFIWHGFNYPDSLPARQSFIYIFLVMVMSFEAFSRVRELERQQIVYGYICAVLFCLFCEKFITHEDFETGVKFLTFLFVTVYAVLLYFYHTPNSWKGMRNIAIILVLVIMTECGINGWKTGIGTHDRASYLKNWENYEILYREAKKYTGGFVRTEQIGRKTKNDSMLGSFQSASLFSSTLNSSVADLYERLGMRHSKVYYSFDGATPLVSAMMNVDYLFADSPQLSDGYRQLFLQTGQLYLYKNRYQLPLGYTVSYEWDIPDGFEKEPLNLQNQIVHEWGVDGDLFESVHGFTAGDDCGLTAETDGYYYAVVTSANTAKIHLISEAEEEKKVTDLKKGCVIPLGFLARDNTITLTNGDSNDTTPKVTAKFYRMDETVMDEAILKLSQCGMKNVQWRSDTLSGKILLESPARVVISIPYENGWKVLVNDVETKPATLGNCLMALDLNPGEYRIEMKYIPEGKTAGLWISIGSLMVCILLFCKDQYKLRRMNREKGKVGVSDEV